MVSGLRALRRCRSALLLDGRGRRSGTALCAVSIGQTPSRSSGEDAGASVPRGVAAPKAACTVRPVLWNDSGMAEPDVRDGHLERAKRALSEVQPAVAALRSGVTAGTAGETLELIARAAVVRQSEVLGHSVDAVSIGDGSAVAAMVRPAVEEFVALKYLPSRAKVSGRSWLILWHSPSNAANVDP